MLADKYVPKKFGKEYCNIKGSEQYPMFLAVALGAKTSYDDWIPIKIYDEFVDICSGYGLHVEPDVLFQSCRVNKSKVIGGENITTTFQVAKRFSRKEKDGEVHVFVARKKDIAVRSKIHGWYPIIVNQRMINKPFIDHLRFGRLLGFPSCCVDFFRRYNNWHFFSHPFETLKNTKKIENRAIGSYYCNNFLMDNTYFLIHHLPCSYRCENTINLARKVEKKIDEVEPAFVKVTKSILRKPLLVFGERHFIIFDGKLTLGKEGYRLDYSGCKYLKNPARPEENIESFNNIKKGNKLFIDDDSIKFLKGEDQLLKIKKKPQWFAIDFD